MAGYNEIKGLRVKYLSDDPSNAEDGQVWYNSTLGNLRVAGIGAGTWVSSTNLPTGRDYGTAGGTSTAGFIAGGELGPGTFISTTFDYDGSGWSASGAMGDARIRMNLGVSGTQTAGLGVGGYSPGVVTSVEEYDGSSWTGGGALPTATQQSGGAGPQTSYMMLGTDSDRSEGLSYNGSAWGAEGSSSQGFAYGALAGQETAALAFYGATSPAGASRSTGEEYNGTAWTTVVPSLPNQGSSGAGGGTSTAAVFAGSGTTARYWNGTTVAATTSMANPRANYGAIGGTPGAFVAAGGNSNLAATEEFNFGTNTITAAAWASGTNMPESNYGAGSFGTQTAFVYFGGMPYPPRTNATREYNGTSWATTGNYTGTVNYLAGTGVETAGLGAGGFTGTATPTASAEYDGSSWTAGNSMNQGRMNTGSTMAGTQTAAAIAGGDQFPSTPRSLTAVEEYDGTNWTAVTALPTATQNMAVTGPQTASVFAGGISDTNPGTPNAFPTNVYEYDGTNWTSGTALPIATYRAGAAGTQTDALIFSGGTSPGGPGGPGESVTTLGYDGTSWSTRPNMGTARQSVGAGGTASPSTAAIGAGGYIIPGTTASTEEFTGQTSVAAPASTLTTS